MVYIEVESGAKIQAISNLFNRQWLKNKLEKMQLKGLHQWL